MATPSDDISILILGATGYIGGAIAAKLNKVYPDARYTAYARSADKANIVRKYGYEPLISTGNRAQDFVAIKEASKNVDVVINAADADDLELTKAILAGLRESLKRLPILLHTRSVLT